MVNRLDDFTLAEGYEIPKATEENLDRAIIGYVDKNYWRLDSIRNEVAEERKNNLIGRLIAWIGEDQKGAQLYDTLSSYMGMTDEEIRQSGFLSLVPYFDKDCYAQTIAEYLIHVGTENTTTGNWHARDMIFALCDQLTDPKQIMEYVRTGCEIVYVWDERLEG